MTDSADRIDVERIAHLARIELTADEAAEYQPQLEQIVGYVDKLKELDLSEVEPTAHAMPMRDVVREDQARPGLDRERVMANAPISKNGQIVVPKIVDSGG